MANPWIQGVTHPDISGDTVRFITCTVDLLQSRPKATEASHNLRVSFASVLLGYFLIDLASFFLCNVGGFGFDA